MKTFRRTLNLLAALYLVAAGAGLASFIGSGSSKNTVPFAFVGALALFPALAHLIASIWAWPTSLNPGLRLRAVWGLSLASISLFTWFLLALVVVELGVREGHFVIDWPRAVLAVGLVLVLPSSAAANLRFFQSALVVPLVQHEA